MIVLIGAVVALAGFYATQGSRDSTGSTPVEVAPAPKTPPRVDASEEASPARARAKETGVPLAVARALGRRKTVVILFRGSGSADDRATGRAVAALRGQRGVAVFTDEIGRLGRYRAVVGELGISQAPAVVIVDRGRSARVVEGYIDPTTLAQDVADTR
jgi:hypothetical protein